MSRRKEAHAWHALAEVVDGFANKDHERDYFLCIAVMRCVPHDNHAYIDCDFDTRFAMRDRIKALDWGGSETIPFPWGLGDPDDNHARVLACLWLALECEHECA